MSPRKLIRTSLTLSRPSSFTKRSILALAIAGIPSVALAEKVSVNLDIPPASNSLSMTISAMNRSDTQFAVVSGNLLADLDMTFDAATNAVTSIDTLELTGGKFNVSDLKFLLDYSFLGHVDITTKGVSGTFDTPAPPGLVTAGSFDAADHQAIFNQGILRADGTGIVGGLLPVNPYIVDLATAPLTASNTGTGSVQVTGFSIAGTTATYDLSLSMPVNVDQLVNPDPAVSVKILGTLQAAGKFSKTFTPTQVSWNVDKGRSWTTADNWDPAFVPNTTGISAYFAGVLTAPNAPATITLDGDKTAGNLFFRNANQYIIAPGTGGSLWLDGAGSGARVQVDSGKHTISAPLILADNATFEINVSARLDATGGVSAFPAKSLMKKGPGILNVTGGINLDAASSLTVQQGTLYADRISAGSAHLNANTLLSLDPDAKSSTASIVHALDIAGATDAWQATVDLNKAALVLQSTAQNLPADFPRVFNQIKSARNFSTDLWTGLGITSTAARNDFLHSGGYTGLGAIINDKGNDQGPLHPLFKGVNADINSILIRYTWNGDANLDGVVNADDYFLIDQGFLTQKPGWFNGDFNYDGIVNADDYFLIDSAFLAQTAPLGHGNVPVVPEPSLLTMAAALAGLLLSRRRQLGCRLQ